MLSDLIARYMDAKRVWEAQFDEDCDRAGDSPEWDVYMDLSDDVISYRCKTADELHSKAVILLSDANIFDTLSNTNGHGPLRRLLASLC
ncbi:MULTISPECIES: hypothetical protein [Rhizobium]|uniref:Uncharacterized protein n=1 Tax=Rhizobium favelukesii TaxID=348824 RepID=W6RPQ1_9HYPH|nr:MULTISPECIES: hypothetical protein [Rhizobium]MCS0462917.1 hypothetical protein [Rhizobium favelukesii]UFS82006.1 hypothetical protein LPB79_27615 [Rhizobium sp. T136]CDM56316.1 hypothetical protein LPU83_0634 [Rhizobium favelukesii]